MAAPTREHGWGGGVVQGEQDAVRAAEATGRQRPQMCSLNIRGAWRVLPDDTLSGEFEVNPRYRPK